MLREGLVALGALFAIYSSALQANPRYAGIWARCHGSCAALAPASALPDLLVTRPELRPILLEVLDAPPLVQDPASPTPKERELVEALKHWNDPKSLHYNSCRTKAAAYWVSSAAQFVAKHPEWGVTEKAAMFNALGKIIASRLDFWSMSAYPTKNGDWVFAGDIHRLVVRNQPGAPVYKGKIPREERDPAAGRPAFYLEWKPELDAELQKIQ